MKRRIIDMVIGQVIMGIMIILEGIAYEGRGYSDFSDIVPYIEIAIGLMLMTIPASVCVFYTAINGLEYLRAKKELKETGTIKEAEQA